MSEDTYDRQSSVPTYCPKVVNDNLLNQAVDGTPPSVALIASVLATVLVPGNPAIDNLPVLQPERNDEEVRSQGDGLNVGEVYDLGWSDGAASRLSKCVFGLHIKDTLGKITAAGITGNVAEISTVTCVADVASSLNSTYFFLDGIDADGDNPVVKYSIWIDVNNAGAAPAITGRTDVEVDIAIGATDTAVALAIKNAIDALDDFGAAVGAGDSDHIVTITNGTAGAVDNVYDAGSTGFTLAVTTDGVTTKVISESTTLPNPGLHNEKEKTGEDIRVDVFGITQLEYIWSCEEGGMLEEERNYLTAWFGVASDLARPVGPDGLAWTSNQHPYSRYKKNFAWGDLVFTFEYNSTAVECKITSISIKVAIEVDYKRDDGSSYSNGREIKARDYEITMTVRPTGTDLRDISNLHYSAYAGDLTLTAKATRNLGGDVNDFQQWAFTKLRLLPIPQDIPIGDFYEEIDIVMHAAPANTTTATIKGYLSQQYYGVD